MGASVVATGFISVLLFHYINLIDLFYIYIFVKAVVLYVLYIYQLTLSFASKFIFILAISNT